MMFMHNRTSKRHRSQGSILLFTLVILVVVMLGALYTMRGITNDSALTDKFAERQKAIDASDFALQWISSQIASTASQQPLEISGTSTSWYLSAPSPVTPDASYWSTCMQGASPSDKCTQVPMPSNVSQSAWVFVEPTGRSDPYACSTQGFEALYYDVWIHTIDQRSNLSADTEGIYKLCIANGGN